MKQIELRKNNLQEMVHSSVLMRDKSNIFKKIGLSEQLSLSKFVFNEKAVQIPFKYTSETVTY
jgi:hypothetical protein